MHFNGQQRKHLSGVFLLIKTRAQTFGKDNKFPFWTSSLTKPRLTQITTAKRYCLLQKLRGMHTLRIVTTFAHTLSRQQNIPLKLSLNQSPYFFVIIRSVAKTIPNDCQLSKYSESFLGADAFNMTARSRSC